MDVREWHRLRRTIHESFYDDLVGSADCGAFDGGCVVVAEALQRVIGGEIVVLVRATDMADHAAVLHDGKLWDYYGPMTPKRFIARFNRDEAAPYNIELVDYRPIEKRDLLCAHREEALVDRLAEKFSTMLKDHRHICGATPSVAMG